jgi:hypothetical protein
VWGKDFPSDDDDNGTWTHQHHNESKMQCSGKGDNPFLVAWFLAFSGIGGGTTAPRGPIVVAFPGVSEACLRWPLAGSSEPERAVRDRRSGPQSEARAGVAVPSARRAVVSSPAKVSQKSCSNP